MGAFSMSGDPNEIGYSLRSCTPSLSSFGLELYSFDLVRFHH